MATPRRHITKREREERRKALDRALLAASRDGSARDFVHDALWDSELDDMANRWQAARLLLQGHTQAHTANQLGLSTGLVGRVAARVNGYSGSGGFRRVFRKMAK